jgi:hypothetical protein
MLVRTVPRLSMVDSFGLLCLDLDGPLRRFVPRLTVNGLRVFADR